MPGIDDIHFGDIEEVDDPDVRRTLLERAKRGPDEVDWTADSRTIDTTIKERKIEDAESRERLENALSPVEGTVED